jgi:hypothetical protein
MLNAQTLQSVGDVGGLITSHQDAPKSLKEKVAAHPELRAGIAKETHFSPLTSRHPLPLLHPIQPVNQRHRP